MILGNDAGKNSDGSHHPRLQDVGRLIFINVPPLGLAILLWFHPTIGDNVYDALTPVVEMWLTLHALLLVLFGLLGLSLYLLLTGFHGLIATIGRIGASVYLVFYIAFESIAGIAAGVLVREGRTLPAQQEAGIIEAVGIIYTDPVGGYAGLFAFIGFVGYVIAVVAIAIVQRRNGVSIIPLGLLIGSSMGIIAHGSSPSDSIGLLLFAVAGTWIELSRVTNQNSAT